VLDLRDARRADAQFGRDALVAAAFVIERQSVENLSGPGAQCRSFPDETEVGLGRGLSIRPGVARIGQGVRDHAAMDRVLDRSSSYNSR